MSGVVKIVLSTDSYQCECCGWNVDDYGLEVFVNDQKVIDKPAVASCYGNGSECYSIFDQLKIMGDGFNIPYSELFKTEEDFEDDNQYDQYYLQMNEPKAFETIVKDQLTKLGYKVQFQYEGD